jgi:hypothetical protein
MFIEYKQGVNLPWVADEHHTEDPKWSCVNAVPVVGRDYNLFAALASVRGKGPRVPLGLPDNISDIVKRAWVEGGDHSPSHMYLEEFERVLFEECDYKRSPRQNIWGKFPLGGHNNEYNAKFPDLVNYCYRLKEEKSIDKVMFGEHVSSEVQVRLVFWFDS